MRLLSAIAVAAILAAGTTPAHSKTITFEGLCAPDGEIANISPYDHFRWAHIGAVGKDAGGGYAAVAHGDVAGYSWGGWTARFSSKTPFSLFSGHFAAAWHSGLQVTFSAYRDGVLMGTKIVLLDPVDTKLLFDDSFAHIDTVTFHASGHGHPPNTNQLGFDNLKVVLDR